MRVAKRVEALPPYLFAELDKLVDQSFGIGHPETFEDAFTRGPLSKLHTLAGVTSQDVQKLGVVHHAARSWRTRKNSRAASVRLGGAV